jgi:hypothetical protein
MGLIKSHSKECKKGIFYSPYPTVRTVLALLKIIRLLLILLLNNEVLCDFTLPVLSFNFFFSMVANQIEFYCWNHLNW